MPGKIRTAVLLTSAVAFAGLTGCASTSDLEALQAEVQKANDTAARAAADAAAAKRDAADAKALAQQANSTAQQANTTASETSEKLDRMFKKSMSK